MSEVRKEINKIGAGQFYNLITGGEVSWQAIIYDLIKTEQLDPWDIDIGVLADKYAIIVQEMEEADFWISSKVLLACSLLLRLKSEILLNRYIQEMDEAIYGKSEDKKYLLERIELDEDEIPILVPKTPMARYKKVTLQELMGALNKAIETENRRIRKDIKARQAEKSALVVLPNSNRIPLKDRIEVIFRKIIGTIQKPSEQHITFSQLAPTREEKLASFLPVLHLSNSDKLFITQLKHFDEIYMRLEQLQEEIDLLKRELGEAENISKEDEAKMEEELGELEDFEDEMKTALDKKKLKQVDKELEEDI
ncbi:MAG: segregation/condensation protein A [archaeon]